MKSFILAILSVILLSSEAQAFTRSIDADSVQGLQTTTNYIKNSTPVYNTAGWVTYADAAGVVPVDGTGGAAGITWTRNTITPVFLTADFLYTKDAANRQGNGFSYDALVPVSDRPAGGVTLGVSFTSLLTSGTYTSDDLKVFAYDVANAVLLNGGQPILLTSPTATAIGGVVAVATASQHSGSVFIPQTCTSVRFIVHQSTTNAAAYNIQFSKFSLNNNPFTYSSLSNGQYLGALTTTGSWSTNTTYSGIYYRLGDRLAADIIISLSGAPTSATLTVNIPSGYVIDVNKIASSTAGIWNPLPGSMTTWYDAAPVNSASNHVAYSSTTAVQPVYDVGDSKSAAITQAAPITFASGDFVRVQYEVPIVGWEPTSQNLITPAKSGDEQLYMTGYVGVSGVYVKYRTAATVPNPLSTLGVLDNTSFTKVTILKKSLVFFDASGPNASGQIRLSHFNSAGTELKYHKGYFSASIPNTVSMVVFGAMPGDYFTVQSTNGLVDDADSHYSIALVDFEQQMLSAMPIQQTCYIKDVKAYNAAGGSASADTTATRTLNVMNENGGEVNSGCSFASLASDIFTLQPGIYDIEWSAPANWVTRHMSMLRLGSAGALVSLGEAAYSSRAIEANTTVSTGTARVNIGVATAYEIAHYTTQAQAGDGFGLTSGKSGYSSIFTQVKITKVK